MSAHDTMKAIMNHVNFRVAIFALCSLSEPLEWACQYIWQGVRLAKLLKYKEIVLIHFWGFMYEDRNILSHATFQLFDFFDQENWISNHYLLENRYFSVASVVTNFRNTKSKIQRIRIRFEYDQLVRRMNWS